VLLACALAILAAGYFLWFRDSSLVAVEHVEVSGVTTGDREAIVGELTRTAESMTTLHSDDAALQAAAAAFPTVKSVSIQMSFPHGARIEVVEHRPALVATWAGQRVPVAADGTLLPGVPVPDDGGLPELRVDEAPDGGRLAGDALDEALVLGAAPAELRGLIESVEMSEDYGVEVMLRGEIPVRFGGGGEAAEKWAAASAVLADPKLDSLCNLDVRVPSRPAAGCAAEAVAAEAGVPAA
jgi:cell division protein FtsQ